MMATPGVGIVVAGVASGICFLLIHNLRKRKAEEERTKSEKSLPTDNSRCACCLQPFITECGRRCSECGAYSCKRGCSRRDQIDDTWNCLFCHQKRTWLKKNDRWFEAFGSLPVDIESQLNFSTAKSQIYIAGVEHEAINRGLDLAAGGQEERHSLETVRDMIEKIVEELVGNVDGTPIDRMYDHPAYDELLAEYSALLTDALVRLTMAFQASPINNSSSDTPSMARTALRELVERAMEEARKLPALRSSGTDEKQELNVSDKSYEDLLATAILNKVIEKFQNENVDGNSNALHSKSSSEFGHKQLDSDVEFYDEEDDGSSSLEPLSQDECNSDCNTLPSKRVRGRRSKPLSLTIEERIEEVTTTYTSDEDIHRNEDNGLDFHNARRVPFPELGMDIVDPSQESSDDSEEGRDSSSHIDVIAHVESWEENWLFQKKKMQARSEAVSMLVPNPSADYRALIGDKDAEDTSDLSECSAQSDEEIEQELKAAINSVIPKCQNELELEATAEEEQKERNAKENIDINMNTNSLRERTAEEMERYLFDASTKAQRRNKCNGNVKDERKETLNLAKAETQSTNPFARTIARKTNNERKSNNSKSREDFEFFESKVEKIPLKKGNPFQNMEIPVDIHVAADTRDSDNFASKSPATPMPTPVAEDAQKTICCDLSLLKEKLENVKNPFISELNKIVKNGLASDVHDKVDMQGEDGVQREREYTEHYDIAIQRHVDSLRRKHVLSHVDETDGKIAPVTSATSTNSKINSTLNATSRKCRETSTFDDVELTSQRFPEEEKGNPDIELSAPPRPGTIAEREHKKWENAPPIENNPYSEENIQKRLLERQYSRRSSELSTNSDSQKVSDSSVPIIFTDNKVDVKRFGRDYYINEAKSPSGGSFRRSVVSNSSRPTSAMSQYSNSTGSDLEQQSKVKCSASLTYSTDDVKSKVAKWQHNNIETSQTEATEKKQEESSFRNELIIPCPPAYRDMEVEQFLEHERKNSKNEVNAKLNNCENGDNLDSKMTCLVDERQKKIRRLDLKAYGFENEINTNSNATSKPSQQRVVNKLDLKSFGYDSGLRRTQSINQLDSKSYNEDNGILQSEMVKAESKSNLTQHRENENHSEVCIFADSNGNRNSRKNSETLYSSTYFGSGMKSAKSVPNILDREHYMNSVTFNRYGKGDVSKYILAKRDFNKRGRFSDENGYRSSSETLSDKKDDADSDASGQIDEPLVKNEAEKSSNESLSLDNFLDKELPMPSVRRLAEAFNKAPTEKPTPTPRTTKAINKVEQERSKTPEIQIIVSPKQMHSLTARSLSKEFREGLRQIPNKVPAFPVRNTMKEDQIFEQETFTKNSEKDTDIILPGKLKDNIQFWEQLQKRF